VRLSFWKRRAPASGTSSAPPRALLELVPETVILGGRRYTIIEQGGPLAYDDWYMGLVRRLGMDDILQQEGESDADFGVRILQRMIDTGARVDLIAARLMPFDEPQPVTWQGTRARGPQMVAETSAHLGAIDDPAEKQRVNAIMLEVWNSFFQQGRRSYGSSPSSSLSEARKNLLDEMQRSASGAR
jgi:hypothetical protein